MPELSARVVTGDAAVLVAQKCLSVFFGYACRSKATAKRVFQIVNPDRQIARVSGAKVFLLPEFRRSHSRLLPSRVVHPVHCVAVVRKNPFLVQAALLINDRLGNAVHHYHALVAILHVSPFVSVAKVSRDQEHADAELRHRNFPIPFRCLAVWFQVR
mgnify:CR=1 FL=1